jgi:Mn-dependent DtxR family transcriptional regulator
MPLQESGQMYLETIYILSQKSDHVRSIDICEQLGYSKPSVSRAVGILKREGMLETDADGYLLLTNKGRELAEQLYERHTVLTHVLTALGVDEEIAAEDACRIEHVISEESFAAMKRFSEKKEQPRSMPTYLL